MSTRTVGIGAGWRWLMTSVNLGRTNPKAVFGAAGLFIVAALLIMIAFALVAGGVGLVWKPDGIASAMVFNLLVMTPLIFVFSGLFIGYLRIIHATETGQPASATDIFSGFSDGTTLVRAGVFALLLSILQNVLIALLIATLAPDMAAFYAEAIQAGMAGAPQMDPAQVPPGMGAAFAVIMLFALFFSFVQAIGMGQIALSTARVSEAFADGFGGTVKNVLAIIVFGLMLFVLFIVLMLVSMLLVALLTLVMKLAGVVGLVLAVPLYLALLVIAIVVSFGVMYAVWRDICGDGVPAAPVDARDDHVAM